MKLIWASVLLALFIFPVQASDVGSLSHWEGKQVIVENYLPPDYPLSTIIADYNQTAPKHTPQLVEQDQAPIPCDQIPPTAARIVICLGTPPPGDIALTNFSHTNHHVMTRARMIIDPTDPPDDRPRVLCHEMMHAYTGVRDNNVIDPGTGYTTYPYPDQSCVWGELGHLGPLDIRIMKQAYKKGR